MSITFSPDLQGELPILKPCLCTQNSPEFGDWMQYGPGMPSVMRAAAWNGCDFCYGTGVESSLTPISPTLNFSNTNAFALLRVMGMEAQPDGEMTIPLVRRGIMRGRARRSLDDLIEPMSNRFVTFGVSAESIRERLDRFSNFVESAASLGAGRIFWY